MSDTVTTDEDSRPAEHDPQVMDPASDETRQVSNINDVADKPDDLEDTTLDSAEANAKNALKAAKKHDFPLLRQILQTCKDIDLNRTDNMGKTVLHYLCSAMKLDDCKLCLEKGADVNILDRIGWTPLHYATIKGEGELVKLLVAHGADCNLKDKQKGRTALHYAVSKNHTTVVDTLLQCGADPRIEDEEANTPGSLAKTEVLKDRIDEAVTRFTDQKCQMNNETKEIPCDRPTVFPGLGASVTPADVSQDIARNWQGFTLSIKRDPLESGSKDFVMLDTEELCSDVFTYKVSRRPNHVVKLDISLPVISPPDQHEELVIKTTGQEEFEAISETKDDGTFVAKARLELTALTSLIVLCRPKQERFACGQGGSRIQSAVDSRVELEVERGTFDSPTTITLEITEPPEKSDLEAVMSKCNALTSTTSFYGLESGGQVLAKPIMVKIPLRDHYTEGRLIVLTMDAPTNEEKPEAWRIVDTSIDVTAGRVQFPVSTFCVKVVVELTREYSSMSDSSEFGSTATLLSQVSRVFRRSRRKEHTIVMFCMTKRVGTSNSFKLLVQCCKEDQFQSRHNQLEEEGFEMHPQGDTDKTIHIARAKARDKFKVHIDDFKHSSNQDDTIEFHPKADNHRGFSVQMSTNEKFRKGTVTVTKLVENDDGDVDGQSEVSEEVLRVTVVLERFHPEMMNKRDGKSFLTYKRMVQLQEKIGNRWWKMFLLLDVPFKTLETYCKENPSEEETVNGLLFDWRERYRATKSRGIPLLLSAMCKCGLGMTAKDIQIELIGWRDTRDNEGEPFWDWLQTAYRHSLLLPTHYDVPMSDSFLAMVADLVKPSADLAVALQLPASVVTDVIADNKTFPTAGLKTLKLFDLYRTRCSDKGNVLLDLWRAINGLKMKEAVHYIEQAAAAWLKHSGKDADIAKEVESLLSEANCHSKPKR